MGNKYEIGGDGYISSGSGYLQPETAEVLGESIDVDDSDLTSKQLEEVGAALVEAFNQMLDWTT